MKIQVSAERGMRSAGTRSRRHAPRSAPRIPNRLVGGVNSPARSFRAVGAEPLIVTRAHGAEIIDVQGRRYVDFIAGWGAVILGHRAAPAAQALRGSVGRGWLFGLTHPAEAELAGLISRALPSAHFVRLTVSGTEACMTAVKLARAHTGRHKLLKFAGCYHGHGDSLMAGSTAGVPDSVSADLLTVPYNDVGALETAFRRSGNELAGVIVEPVAANMGVVPPEAGFLERLRDLTRGAGCVLIFDEVVTGFRLGIGGAQGAFQVTPDLTILGKILGGGLPVGAVAGDRAIMRRLSPEGDVYHAGTFAGHPLAMAAGVAVLTALQANPPYRQLEQVARRLADGLAAAADAVGVPVTVNRAGSMMTLFFTRGPVRNAVDAASADRVRFAAWANGLRDRGILVPPSQGEALFVSAAHTPAQIERMIAASRAVFSSWKPAG
jgi:glutamate-1-semialdehyde 2,1-aminomutase